MTAATEVDLEAWMQGELERPCEAMPWPGTDLCPQRAAVIAYLRCPNHGSIQVFFCQPHAEETAAHRAACDECRAVVACTWVERIKR